MCACARLSGSVCVRACMCVCVCVCVRALYFLCSFDFDGLKPKY